MDSRFGLRWPGLFVGSTLVLAACSGRSLRHDGSVDETGGASGANGDDSGGDAGGGRGGSNPSGGEAGTGRGGSNASGGVSGTDGSGGIAGNGGDETGGTGGVSSCVPGQTTACACTDGRSGAQACDDTGRYGPCECRDPELLRVRRAIVGSWAGTRTSSWDGAHRVTVDFLADSTWRASCEDDACDVFYWGGYEDDPENGYSLASATDDGIVEGMLRVSWELGSSTQWGELRVLSLSTDETELRFEFRNTWSGGGINPLEFELVRTER